MKRDLVDILACPLCRAPLELRAEPEEEGDVMQGSLRCTRCGGVYPIDHGIPNFLPKRPLRP